MVNLPSREVKEKIEQAESITILSHLNPDAETLGTSLGIYALLSKVLNKRVEVVNASHTLPISLDFLPNFKKIKHLMDYKQSLIIACNCTSIDHLGFDLEGRDIVNIDQDENNTLYGCIDVVVTEYASASQVAFVLFKEIYRIDTDTATCFYTTLLSKTRYFTSENVNKEVFSVAKELLNAGAKQDNIAYNLTQRRPLASLRILQRALASLSLCANAQIATLSVTRLDIEATGATLADMEEIVEYAKSLVTVEIALFVMEIKEGICVLLRSKKVDLSQVALAFGGKGHKQATSFTMRKSELYAGGLQESIDTILKKIKALHLLS